MSVFDPYTSAFGQTFLLNSNFSENLDEMLQDSAQLRIYLCDNSLCGRCVFIDRTCLSLSFCLCLFTRRLERDSGTWCLFYFLQLMGRNLYLEESGVRLLFIWLYNIFFFKLFSLCDSVSFRCGVTSWLFSPRSTAAPPTWWWLCGSLCPSGKIRLKNDTPPQVFLGLIETYSTHYQLHNQSVKSIYLLQPKRAG